MKAIAIAVAAIIALAVAWFLVSPLFIDRTVDEPLSFDNAATSNEFDMTTVMAMPESERLAAKDDIMASAAAMPDKPATDSMPGGQPLVVARGEFRDADAVHKGSGTASVYRLPSGEHVVRFEDFRTTNGPDLAVFLAVHEAPASTDDVTDGGYLNLGKLKGNVGNQNYPLPAGSNPADYGSVVIWCELFGVLFSPASLTPVDDAPVSDDPASG